jgi:drug/metabolite transporter (DMT)-like permease
VAVVSAIFALAASLLWGAADFAGGLASRRLPALTVMVLSQGVALAGVAVVVVATGGGPWGAYLLYGVACGVVGPVALAAFYRALAIAPMGLVAPIAAVGVAIPVLVGVASGDALQSAHLAGIGLAVVGIVLASGPELRASDGTVRHALALALVAAAGFGTVFVLIAGGSQVDVGMTLLVQRLTNVCLGVLALLVVRPDARPGRADLRLIAFVGIADVGANAAFGFASQAGLLSVTSVLASLYPVVTALLARQLLRERLTRVQVAGVTSALGGVLLLAGAG